MVWSKIDTTHLFGTKCMWPNLAFEYISSLQLKPNWVTLIDKITSWNKSYQTVIEYVCTCCWWCKTVIKLDILHLLQSKVCVPAVAVFNSFRPFLSFCVPYQNIYMCFLHLSFFPSKSPWYSQFIFIVFKADLSLTVHLFVSFSRLIDLPCVCLFSIFWQSIITERCLWILVVVVTVV